MPATAEELWAHDELEDGSNASAERGYRVLGASTCVAARDAIRDEAPETIDGLVRTSVFAERVSDYAGGTYRGRVRYGYPGPNEFEDPGTETVRYEIGGRTTRIKQSKETISATVPVGSTVLDWSRAINVVVLDDGSTEVEGVEVPVGEIRMVVTGYYPTSDITPAYALTLAGLVGTTNNAVYKGWAAGTLLFLGASDSPLGNGTTRVEFELVASPNIANVQVDPAVTVPAKGGHQLLWIHHAPHAGNPGDPILPRVRQANVERVFDTGDFTLLAP